MIKRRLYPELGLIVHSVTGALQEDEFTGAVVALYDLDPVPPTSLWDFSEASVHGFDQDRIRKVLADLVGKVRGREGGRTAAVAPSDYTFASGRQYTALSEPLHLPFVQEIFRTRAEALEWLGCDELKLKETASQELASPWDPPAVS